VPLAPDVGLERYEGAKVILGIRPADLEDAAVHPDGSLPWIEVSADVTEELGSEVNVLFSIDAAPVALEELIAVTEEGDAESLGLLGEEPRSVLCARVDARTSVGPWPRSDVGRGSLSDTGTGR
jgi:multiple sugar transport system ATP-binding protein